MLFGGPPSFDDLHMFGFLYFAYNQCSKDDKFASQSRMCVFVGYPFGKKGWYLYEMDSKKFFMSRDLKFFEDIVPYLDGNAATIKPDHVALPYGSADTIFYTYFGD